MLVDPTGSAPQTKASWRKQLKAPLCMALFLCVGSALPGRAEDVPAGARALRPQILQQLDAVDLLVEAGRAARDPWLLVAGARLLQATGIQPPAPADDVPKGEGVADYPPASSIALLQEARDIAKATPQLLPLIDDMLAIGSKGAADGMITKIGRLPANGQLSYEDWEFAPSALALVHVVGKGVGDIDIVIYNANGTAICKDTDLSNSPFCSWTPPKQQRYVIKIINKLGKPMAFRLTTN